MLLQERDDLFGKPFAGRNDLDRFVHQHHHVIAFCQLERDVFVVLRRFLMFIGQFFLDVVAEDVKIFVNQRLGRWVVGTVVNDQFSIPTVQLVY